MPWSATIGCLSGYGSWDPEPDKKLPVTITAGNRTGEVTTNGQAQSLATGFDGLFNLWIKAFIAHNATLAQATGSYFKLRFDQTEQVAAGF